MKMVKNDKNIIDSSMVGKEEKQQHRIKKFKERKEFWLAIFWIVVLWCLPIQIGEIIGKYFGVRTIGIIIGGIVALFLIIYKVSKSLEKENH